MAGYTTGTAFLRIAPSMLGFHTKLSSELKAIRPEPVLEVKIKPKVNPAEFRAPRVQDQTVKINAKVDTKSFTDTANSVALLARNMSQLALPIGIAAAVPTVLALGAAAAQTSTALLLLPAAGFAVAGAFGAVKIGLSNVSDALGPTGTPAQLKKVQEALAKLSPEARQFVAEIRSLTPAFDSMKIGTQDALLRGLSETVGSLGRTYLPIAKVGFSGIATEINLATQDTAKFIGQAQQVSTVQQIFGTTRETMAELRPVGRDIVAMLLDIAAVGMQFLPGLAAGFASGTARAREFFAEARQSGQLKFWISEGLSAIGDLAMTLINLGSIVASVFRGAGIESRSFTESLRDTTARVAEFMRSGEGQSQIATLFTSLRAMATALLPLIGAIALGVIGMINTLGPAMPPLVQGITDILVAAQPLMSIFSQLAVLILPALGATLSFLAPVLGPLVGAMVAAYTAGKIWAGVLFLKTAAIAAYNIALGIAKVAQLAYILVTNSGARALALWTAAQWLLNAAMTANPIGIVIVAIAALVAAIVLAWQHSETFRNIVMAAWEGIKTAASATWDFLVMVFEGIKTGLTAVGQFFTMLWGVVTTVWNAIGAAIQVAWDSVIKPVFDFIVGFIQGVLTVAFNVLWTVVRVAIGAIGAIIVLVWQTLIEPIFNAWVAFINNVLIPVINFLWQNVIVPAWNGIGAAISFAYNSIILPIWDALVAFVNNIIIPLMNFLWNNVIVPVWNGIGAAISFVYNSIILPIWTALVGFVNNVIIPAIMFLWNNVIKPAWDGIGSIIQTVYNSVIKPTFDAFVAAGEWVGRKFDEAVAFIRGVWDKVKAAVRDPIQAVIDVVYNRGIVDSWNVIADFIGLPDQKLAHFILPQFAQGGKVVGVGTGTSDSILARVSAGEYVVPEKTTRRHLPFLEALRAGQPEAVQAAGGVRANPSFRKQSLAGKYPFGYATGGLIEHAKQVAASMNGRPYIWGGAGPVGADCSGYQSIITNALRGAANPYFRLGTTGTFPWSGFANGLGGAYSVGAFKGNPGHMAGTLGGVNVESGGSHGNVAFGGPAAGADSGQFNIKAFLPEVGGVFASGGGGGGFTFDPLAWMMEKFGDIVGTISGLFGGNDKGIFGIARGFSSKIWESIKKFALEKVTAWGGGAMFGNVLTTGPVQDIIKSVAATYGWDGAPQWPAIQFIVSHESGFNPNAQNPTSTAYGLFQLLDGTWGTTGVPKSADPAQQTRAGLNYIRSRYGNPVGAMNFWRAHNWYDEGGIATGSGFMMKQALNPERVLSGRQTRAFEALVSAQTGRQYGTRIIGDSVDTAGAVGPAGTSPFIGTLVVPVPDRSSVDETIDAVMTRARAESRRGRYSRP